MTGSRGGPHSFDQAAAPKSARWLQAADGDAPVLLIAPHGGQAGPATRALLNPKVNDLYTADITHELAQRLGAGAIINSGMDRNRLDLNRLSQVMSEAPWMLELIAARLERIVAQRGRAVVLLIHGWNVIEPRVDVGIGVKSANGALLPACGAHVSASDGFVNGPLVDFFEVARPQRYRAHLRPALSGRRRQQSAAGVHSASCVELDRYAAASCRAQRARRAGGRTTRTFSGAADARPLPRQNHRRNRRVVRAMRSGGRRVDNQRRQAHEPHRDRAHR